MTFIGLTSVVLAGVNCVLALVLGAVYWRNHRDIRSPFTMGLLLFAAFLLVHNALVVYHAFTMMETASPFEENILLLEQLLQTAASGTLVYATLR